MQEKERIIVKTGVHCFLGINRQMKSAAARTKGCGRSRLDATAALQAPPPCRRRRASAGHFATKTELIAAAGLAASNWVFRCGSEESTTDAWRAGTGDAAFVGGRRPVTKLLDASAAHLVALLGTNQSPVQSAESAWPTNYLVCSLTMRYPRPMRCDLTTYL